MNNCVLYPAHIGEGNSDVEVALGGLLEDKCSLVDIDSLIKPLYIEEGIAFRKYNKC